METPDGTDRQVPGLPSAPPAAQLQDPGPPRRVASGGKDQERLAGGGWARPRRVRAAASGPRRRQSAPDRRREAGTRCGGGQAGASAFSSGAGARESLLGPRAPPRPPPRGGTQAPGWPGRLRGRAYLPLRRWTPRRLRPSPRQPPPPSRRHVGQTQPITRRGWRGAPWEGKRDPREVGAEDVPRGGSEARAGSRCGVRWRSHPAPLRLAPSAPRRPRLSVPGSARSPRQAQPPTSRSSCPRENGPRTRK